MKPNELTTNKRIHESLTCTYTSDAEYEDNFQNDRYDFISEHYKGKIYEDEYVTRMNNTSRSEIYDPNHYTLDIYNNADLNGKPVGTSIFDIQKDGSTIIVKYTLIIF